MELELATPIAGRWLSIIGIGEDGVDGLSPAARSRLSSARLVVGGARHLALAGPLVQGERLAWPSPLHSAFPAILARRGEPVVVLATGDPFHYGIGKLLAGLVPSDEWQCLPQPSAFSLAAARLGWSQPDTALVTLHGRAPASLIRHLQPGAHILALSWDATTPGEVARLLTARGFGPSRLTVLQAMGGVRERITHGLASTFAETALDALNTIAIEVEAEPGARVLPLAPGLDDACFEHDGQLSKREVRAVTLSALAPCQGELLWDIGLGAGSIAIEWLLCHPSMRAIGIEDRADRAACATRNALSLGTPDLTIVTGPAPAALHDLPLPDAVFIGGGLSDPGVFETAWSALKPGGRLVANAVTLESESRLARAFAEHGGELVRISITRAAPVGCLTGWRPAMPVTQWRGIKP